MAATINTQTITNLPPVWASDDSREQLYQFRSIERTGYLTVTELVRDLLADAVNEAALTIINVAIVETHMSTYASRESNGITKYIQYVNANPANPKFLAQRIRKIDILGAGYNEDDELLHYIPGARANVKIKVTAVDSDGLKGIKEFEVLDSGDYNIGVNPLSDFKPLEFRRRLNPKAAMTKNLDYSYDTDKVSNKFYFQSRHQGNGWVLTPSSLTPGALKEGPNVIASFKGAVQTIGGTTPNWWQQSFGDGSTNPRGRGGPGDIKSLTPFTGPFPLTALVGSQAVTRWPVDGIWANIKPGDNEQIFPGSEIMLVPGFANTESYIPAGTLVTKVEEIEVVNGLTSQPASPTTANWYETTDRYIYMTVDQTIKIDKGDQFYVRGAGATFSDTTTLNDTAEIFQVVTEATERIDPLAAGRATVTGTLTTVSTTAGVTSMALTTLTHAKTAWNPTIFEGAVVDHTGTLDLAGAKVASVTQAPGALTATVTLDTVLAPTLVTAMNASATKTYTFDLPVTQSYRIAFIANGKQTLSLAAGTAVQLRNDANVKVARVADYLGGINDITGYIGDVPSKTTLSTTEKVAGLGGRIGGSENVTGLHGTERGANVLVITTITATDRVYPGWVLDYSLNATITGTLQGNMQENTYIIEQMLPLDAAASEILGGKGRYRINKSYAPLATVALTFTGLGIAKCIDRNIDPNDVTQGFINRSVRVSQYPEAYPLSYYVAFAKQGMFFGIWEGSWAIMQKSRKRQLGERDSWFNWMLIQRPVHRLTGAVRTGGQSPVFCINSVGYRYWKFIVRERDVMHPTQGDADTFYFGVDEFTGNVKTIRTPYRVPADAHTEDSHALLNTTHQIALTEDSKYLVSFLYNLTTPRFRYSDELDLLGQTAADVAMASSDVKITAYGEPKQRVYKSLAANLPYNAGLRVCVLKDIYV